ncbi:LOB domain-containing protein 4-like [Henckelia pumila]|uniref:LOB domain-containing protein 4-like n=1 Tax=Henckelia pumila TaxID=405737 RepID=UPI003C6E48C0
MKESSGRKQGATSPCAACKLLRRRCTQDCVFSPYFPADEPHKFASVHKVFGASNVKQNAPEMKYKIICGIQDEEKNWNLQELPEHQRGDAVSSMVYEANARVRDPVYGCVGAISSLQQQIDVLQTQLAFAQAEVVHMRLRQLENASPSSRDSQSHKAKSHFNMDMVVDQDTMDTSLWH